MTQNIKSVLASAGMMGMAVGIVVTLSFATAHRANAHVTTRDPALFCDTVEEVAYYIMLGDDGDKLERLKKTNEHFGVEKVCGLKIISFVEGDVAEVIKSPKGLTIYIVEIDLVGYYTDDDQYKSIPTPGAYPQYAPFTDARSQEASLPISLAHVSE